MRRQDELGLCRQSVSELEVDRRPAGREVNQRRVGEADIDPAGERGDGRIGALAQTVIADGLDLLQVVGVCHRTAGEVSDRAAGALD